MELKDAKTAKKIVKRKNGVIRAKSDFFRTARYGLTLQEHRIIYYAILKGQQDGCSFEPVTISIREFKEMCDLKGQSSYSIIRKISDKLASKVVEVVYKDDSGHHFMVAPWLASITYHAKDGTVTVCPNQAIRPFFEGKPFTDTEFYFLVKFTSQYAERLYELLKALSHKTIVDFETEDLRKRLAVGEKSYPNYAHLREYVLDPAIRDINEYTDLEVTISERRGRYNKIEIVYFTVSKKIVPKLAQRIDGGEFRPPLSEAEQQLFLDQLLGNE